MRYKFLVLLLSSLLFAESPKLLLLEKYKDQNITGFLMSEKLDGIRAFWDGKKLISRGGKIINAPKYFTKNFPPFAIDGELWSARGEFEFIQSVVMDEKPSDEWKKLTYNIFEVPYQKGALKDRLGLLQKYLKSNTAPYLRVIKQIKCKDKAHLESYFSSIVKNGGEGVVLRDPKAPYIDKRTDKALKYKAFSDAECKLIAHHKGKGKYANLLGSFTCKLENGVLFKIGSGLSDEQRKNPPRIGSVVTYKHQGYTKKGKPRFPVFLRVRGMK